MAKAYMGKGPGPSGAARSFAVGPGVGKSGIKAVSPRQRVGKIGKTTGSDMAIPDKAASPSVKGMSIYSNTKKIK